MAEFSGKHVSPRSACKRCLLQLNTLMIRFFRWLFSWRTIRRALIALAVVAALIVALYLVENWRGKRAWEQCKAELEAKGEKLDWQAFVPPPVPDDQNFAMTPLLAPLFDYTFDWKQLKPVWHNPEGKARAEAIKPVDTKSDSIFPGMGDWMKGKPVDLKPWQDYYRASGEFPVSSQPDAPAQAVLKALGKFDAEIDELRTASTRPYARFPVHYEESVYASRPHLGVLMNLTKILTLRANAHLQLNDSAAALDDILFGLQLARVMENEPALISHLVRTACLHMLMQPIWTGLVSHQWNDAQLRALQGGLRIDFLTNTRFALRSERALNIFMFQRMKHYLEEIVNACGKASADKNDNLPLSAVLWLVFGGWFDQNQAFQARLVQENLIAAIDGTSQSIHPQTIGRVTERLRTEQISPYKILAKMSLPGFVAVMPKTAKTQTILDQALIACALERYRLAHSEYPDKLEALTPQFIEKLPHDIFDGNPLRYRREADGAFLLYSIGWNQKDDGGVVAMQPAPSSRQDDKNGDWVWPSRIVQ